MRSSDSQLKQKYILQKLQLSKVSTTVDYEKIIKNLTRQKNKLSSDLLQLKQKVQLLKQKNKRKKKPSKVSRQPEKQYFNVREELNKKYVQLKKMQKKALTSQNKLAIEIQYRQYINRLIDLQNQIQQNLGYLKDEKKSYKRISSQLRRQNRSQQKNSKHPQIIEGFNRQLKNRISILQKIINNQSHSEIQIHNYQIGMKQRDKKVKDLIEHQSLIYGIGDQRYVSQHFVTGDQNLLKNSSILSKSRFLSVNKKLSRQQRAKTQFAQIIPDQQSKSLHHEFGNFEVSNICQNYTSLNRQQINVLSKHEKQNILQLENKVKQTFNKLSILLRKINPTYKRQGSTILISKQIDIFMTKNKILIQGLKAIEQKKIKTLQEYKIYEKYYGPQNQQIDESDMNKLNFFNKRKSIASLNQRQRLQSEPRIKIRDEQIGNEQKIDQNSKDMNRSKSQMKFIVKKNEDKVDKKLQKGMRPKPSSALGKTHFKNITQQDNQGLTLSRSQRNFSEQKKQVKNSLLQNTKKQDQLFMPESTEKHVQTQFASNNMEGQKKYQKQDFIGQLQYENYDFDDRIYGQSMRIQQFTVRYNNKGIGFINAKYQSLDNKNDIQNMPETDIGLKFSDIANYSMKSSKTQLSINDYVKGIKIFFNSRQGFIAKIQIISKFNVKYQYGDENLVFPTALKPIYSGKKYIKYYIFDIKKNQYPSLMYGNYKQIFGNQMLCGWGFKIMKQPKQ